MTYFHGREVHYHRRVGVSRSCSGWEGVGPPSYGRQAKGVIDEKRCVTLGLFRQSALARLEVCTWLVHVWGCGVACGLTL